MKDILTPEEHTRLAQVMTQIAECSRRGANLDTSWKIIQVQIEKHPIGNGKNLFLKKKDVAKGFTTSRTGDTKWYPVETWCINLSTDRPFEFEYTQCTSTRYVAEDGEYLDNWM